MLRILIVPALIVCLIHTPRVTAEEPFEAYLEALQEQQHFDVALAYLDRMAASDLLDADVKEALDYRRGMLLVQWSRITPSPSRRAARLAQAEQALQRFLSSSADHPMAALARSQLGNVMIEQARAIMTQAERSSSDKRALTDQAASIYQRALDLLVQSRAEIGAQYKAMVAKQDAEAQQRLPEVKSQYVQTYLAVARILFEQAETLVGDEPAYRSKLTEAAAAFEEVAQKYRAYSAGIYALLYEGQCYQLLGEHQRALTYFKELIQTADNSAPVRRLKSQAVARIVESLLASDKTRGADRAIHIAKQWLATSREAEQRDPAWAEAKLALAEAYFQKSQVAEKDRDAEAAAQAARGLARELARRKTAVQQPAQQLLVALGQDNQPPLDDTRPQQAETFQEAREAALQVLNEMKLAGATRRILSSQLDRIKDPQRQADIETKLAESQAKEAAAMRQALALFERAAELATDDNHEDLNAVRYYLAYLYYSQERYRRAAVLAGFVALQYPGSAAARECANVALAARQRLYQTAASPVKRMQSERIRELSELMIAKWPGQPQADAALSTLLDLTIQKGDFSKAVDYLKNIPEESRRRGQAELKLGQAIWRQYLVDLQAAETSNAPAPRLEQLKQQARQLLSAGIRRIADEPLNEIAIRSALSLAQLHVDSERPEDALPLLHDERFGALPLSRGQSAWTERIPGLVVEGYRTAIRAHVALAANATDAQQQIRTAQDLLEELQDHLQDRPDAKDQMISIYVGLATGLERQLRIASPQARNALSKGFESFLTNAASGTSDLMILSWAADTFYSMGKGMLDGASSSPEAQRFFTEAAKTYERALELARQDPGRLTSDQHTQLEVRLAITNRQIGRYAQALKLFVKVLSARNKILNVQIEAATTLQQWGRAGNAEGYWLAIQGTEPGNDGRNTIWGWGRIANIVAKNAAYRDLFHRARFNIAHCRYHYALANSGAKQKALLQRAKADILATQKLFDLGGERRQRQYETLLKDIQKSLGEQPVGFSG